MTDQVLLTVIGILVIGLTVGLLIRGLMTATRGNVVAVTVGTAVMGVVAHLDGSGPQPSSSRSRLCFLCIRRWG